MNNEPDNSPVDFSYDFNTLKSTEEIFNLLLDIEQWWSGIYAETIEGKSQKINDEFIFTAGDGAHYSKQKLVELIPNERIVWLVTDSSLKSLSNPSEWNNSKIQFEITKNGDKTKVEFKHEGLTPQIECYDRCSGGWMRYLEQLKKKLDNN